MQQRGQQVWGDDIDRQDRRAAVHTGVVNDRVHPAKLIHLLCHAADLFRIGQVADHSRSASVGQLTDRCQPTAATCVHHHLVSRAEQRVRGRSSQTVSGAGDEDPHHPSPLSP
jgi:hypothetical protein